MAASPRPVNVYEILREGWRETRVDMTLQFFLDPRERHGLGSLVVDALLTICDGVPVLTLEGRGGEMFEAIAHLGSPGWEVSTQSDFIDVLAVNSDLDLALVLENKIGHVLNNPLERYVRRAARSAGVTRVLTIVLAPEVRRAPESAEAWLSRSVTYTELADQVRSDPALVPHLLAPVTLDQRRSLDLLQQFFEARALGDDMPDLSSEARSIDAWRDMVSEHREAIEAFNRARLKMNQLMRERCLRMKPLLAQRIEEAGLQIGWESHGGSGRSEVWNAYLFQPATWSIELKMSSDPSKPTIFVYDYAGRTYKNSTVEPLGVTWETSDEQIADAFIQRVNEVLADRGARARK